MQMARVAGHIELRGTSLPFDVDSCSQYTTTSGSLGLSMDWQFQRGIGDMRNQPFFYPLAYFFLDSRPNSAF